MTANTRSAPARGRRVSQAPLAALGEIRTCLLPHSTALDGQGTEEFLALVPGASVSRRERPGPLAFSPPRAVGVDCHLSRGDAAKARIVGTVASTAVLVGGRLAQMSSHVTVVRAPQQQRRSWSHYVGRVGTVEVIGTLPDREGADQQLTDAYLAASGPGILDIASVCARQLDELRKSPLLDQNPPLLAPITRLRWTARMGRERGTSVFFRVGDDERPRSVTVTVQHAEDLPAALRFCQDVAAHDWLLTVINAKVLAADGFGGGYDRQVEVLAPVLEHLAHLWMPGAHVPDSMRALWRNLQSDAGFSRQWDTKVAQLEHRIGVATYYAARGGLDYR
ncbi:MULTISPECIES: SCO2521 family protein [unclassified Nocardia]|uniref:SCO2521 family protein n=1 Tax=unclassified Nocardia TaxID=2637762 RepID=UPI0035DFF2BF